MKKSGAWKFFNSLWIIFSFIIFLNWLSVLYAGLRVRNRKWTISGIVYAIPVVLLFMFFVDTSQPDDNQTDEYLNTIINEETEAVAKTPIISEEETVSSTGDDSRNDYANENSPVRNAFFFIFLISWLASIIHTIIIRQAFLFQLEAMLSGGQIVPEKTTQPKEKPNIYSNYLEQVEEYKQLIFKQIKSSEFYNKQIVQEIKPLVEKYVKNATEMINREQKLQKMLSQISTLDIRKKITRFEERQAATDNTELKDQYFQSIEKCNEQIEYHKELSEQLEMVHLRLDDALLSLKQIKFDLIRMEALQTEDERRSVIADLETKSDELSEYLAASERN